MLTPDASLAVASLALVVLLLSLLPDEEFTRDAEDDKQLAEIYSFGLCMMF